MLGEVTDIASEFLGVERASLRLLDETRTRLPTAEGSMEMFKFGTVRLMLPTYPS